MEHGDSPLPIHIPLWPKYSPQDPVFKICLACVPLPIVRDRVSHPCSATGNTFSRYCNIFFNETFAHTF